MGDASLLTGVEQFYYREARLLDERKFTQWLELLHPEVQYTVLSRAVTQPDPERRRTEEFLAVEAELNGLGPNECPMRDEQFFQLALRADRATKPNSWSDNPPPRTRRFIANVEIAEQDEGALQVYSNFHLFFSRHSAQNHSYTGRRTDLLIEENGGFKIRSREILPDWNLVEAPGVGLFF